MKRIDLIKDNVVQGQGQWPGGRGTFMLNGTPAGATINLRIVGPDGTTPLVIASLSGEGQTNIEICEGLIDAEMAGGAPADINAIVVQYRP